MKNRFKTTNQERAAIVFKHVKALEGDTEQAQRYGSLALAAPTLIRSAGLVQALAFYEAKGNQKEKEYYTTLINNWTEELKGRKIIPEDTKNLREYAASSCSLVEYMRLTREILALSQWHRRFAQSILKAETGGDT